MLRHLLLALFLIGLSLPAIAVPARAGTAAPAVAGCHDAMPTGAPHHRPDGDDGKATGHLCIGCVASTTLPTAEAPFRPAIIRPAALPTTAPDGAEIPPGIPPPRG